MKKTITILLIIFLALTTGMNPAFAGNGNDSPLEGADDKLTNLKHQTGLNYIPAFAILIFGMVLFIKYTRD